MQAREEKTSPKATLSESDIEVEQLDGQGRDLVDGSSNEADQQN